MSEADIRQADLWNCLECSTAHLNAGPARECSHCGGDLEYLGEVGYENKGLGDSDE